MTYEYDVIREVIRVSSAFTRITIILILLQINQYSTAVNQERGDWRVGSDRRRCIVPDIISYNFISSEERRRAGRKCSNGPAIYESKTISACGTRYKFRTQKAVESRANAIRSEYARKVRAIDRVFAPDMVGESGDVRLRFFCLRILGIYVERTYGTT